MRLLASALSLSVWALLAADPPAVKKPAAKPTPAKPAPRLWSLQPLSRPPVPSVAGVTHPVDAFITAAYSKHGLKPLPPAGSRTLLRRVYLDLTGLPPTPAEQDAFLNDPAPDAYDKLIDRLLASDQYGVRYGRHWLDVLRYADMEENMYAAPGIHYWRDWVINAVNTDVPYDQFVRAQLTGYRTGRNLVNVFGQRTKVERRLDDLFALGFLARGAVSREGKDLGELQISAVETVSSAFLGMTVGCAKCHDHMFDPIRQRDFYAMKALFDPLVIKKQTLATPAEMVANGRELEEFEKQKGVVEQPMEALIAPYREKLSAERVAMLPADIQVVIRKPDKERTPAERKIADDYFPVLRIDPDKIEEVMPEAEKKRYKDLRTQLNKITGEVRRALVKPLPSFWTVEADRSLERERTYILTSGDPERPEKDHPVEPGWPFAPSAPDVREGRVEAFSDWLTAKENPLFARVAVNRLWQWHFGEGLQPSPSDFGLLGGRPATAALLDWLAAEFIARGYSMKAMHKLVLTSQTYRLASSGDAGVMKANLEADPGNRYLWGFRLTRLDAEPIWDAIHSAAGTLDLTLGGPSFSPETRPARRNQPPVAATTGTSRRAAYMIRGFSTSSDVVPNFLQAFDVDDGRAPCPVRTRTVTAPQGLFLMNSEPIEQATSKFADRLRKESGGDAAAAVHLAYRIALSRPPTPVEKDEALSAVGQDPKRLAWLLFNLDEFLYVP